MAGFGLKCVIQLLIPPGPRLQLRRRGSERSRSHELAHQSGEYLATAYFGACLALSWQRNDNHGVHLSRADMPSGRLGPAFCRNGRGAGGRLFSSKDLVANGVGLHISSGGAAGLDVLSCQADLSADRS